MHGVDAVGQVVIRRQLKRRYALEFFKKLQPCLVGIEACASSHHWSRELQALGHTVRLMPPAYVKPYVKRQKNDAADAEASFIVALRHKSGSQSCLHERSRFDSALLARHQTLDRSRTDIIHERLFRSASAAPSRACRQAASLATGTIFSSRRRTSICRYFPLREAGTEWANEAELTARFWPPMYFPGMPHIAMCGAAALLNG